MLTYLNNIAMKLLKFIIFLTFISLAIKVSASIAPHGCTLDFDVLISRTNTDCTPINTSLIILPFGGTPPYSYSTDGGATYTNDSTYFDQLLPGTYRIFVRDSDTVGHTPCEIDYFHTIPDVLALDSITTDSSCSVGSGKINIFVSEGEPNYFYSINNGSTFIPDSNIFKNVTAGTYNVLVQDNKGCSVNSTVTIYGYPAIVPVIDTQDILCNTGIYKGVLDVTFSGNDTYQYSIDGGIVYTSGMSYNNSNLDSGFYDFEIIDKYGCSYNYPFTIEKQLIADSSSFVNELCLDSNGAINLYGYLGESPFEYSIDGGTTYSPAGTFQNLNEGFYYTEVRDNIGCISHDTIRISNFGGFDLSISADDTLCNGNSMTIAGSTNAGSGSNYAWNNALPNAQSHTISPAITTTYSVIVTDNFGCKDTADKLVFVEQQPSVTVNPTNILACVGDTVTITATGANNYRWFNGNTNAVFNTIIQGNSNITVIGNNGKCTDNASVIVQLKPMPTIMLSAAPVTANAGDYINFSSAGSSSSSYSWQFGDGNTSMVSNPIHQYNFGGTYNVKLTGTMAQCSLTDSTTVVINGPPAGIEDILNDDNIVVYPNPTVNDFTLTTTFNASLSILNQAGKLVYKTNITEGNTKLTGLNLMSGIYILKLENKIGVINKKLVVR
jgi:PKD repeat protein